MFEPDPKPGDHPTDPTLRIAAGLGFLQWVTMRLEHTRAQCEVSAHYTGSDLTKRVADDSALMQRRLADRIAAAVEEVADWCNARDCVDAFDLQMVGASSMALAGKTYYETHRVIDPEWDTPPGDEVPSWRVN